MFIDGEVFHYVYDKARACFDELNYDNLQLLRPMAMNIWRAPTDNDRYVQLQWREYGYDRGIPRGYGRGREHRQWLRDPHQVLHRRGLPAQHVSGVAEWHVA